MYSHEPEARDLDMSVCKNVLRDERTQTRESLDTAYVRANLLIKTRKNLKDNNCIVVPDTLHFEPRGTSASMKVHCEKPLKGKTFKGGGLYFIVLKQDADNISVNEENSLQ